MLPTKSNPGPRGAGVCWSAELVHRHGRHPPFPGARRLGCDRSGRFPDSWFLARPRLPRPARPVAVLGWAPHSQWRDRPGFAPGSLLTPAGAPERRLYEIPGGIIPPFYRKNKLFPVALPRSHSVGQPRNGIDRPRSEPALLCETPQPKRSLVTRGSMITSSLSKSSLKRHFCMVEAPMITSSDSPGSTMNSSEKRYPSM